MAAKLNELELEVAVTCEVCEGADVVAEPNRCLEPEELVAAGCKVEGAPLAFKNENVDLDAVDSVEI